MTLIFGVSGHAREISQLLCKEGINYNSLLFVDNSIPTSNSSLNIIAESELDNLLAFKAEAINGYIAIGKGTIRRMLVNKFRSKQVNFPNLISDQNFLSKKTIGLGNIFFPRAYVTTDAVIGNHNHFNLAVTISHDCVMGDYNTFSPGVRIAGNVKIGSNVFFGINSCVIEGIEICNDVILGAGAVVVKAIKHPGTYVGVPARKIK